MNHGPKKPSELELQRSEGPCAQSYQDASRDVMEQFQRVLCSPTSEHPFGSGIDPVIYWDDLEQQLARFCDWARVRHAMKHYAVREAMLDTRPIVVIVDDENTAALEAMSPELLRDVLKKKP